MNSRARVALVVLAAAPLAACGSSGGSSGGGSGSGSGGTSAKSYVHSVCTAISNAGKQIQAAEQNFQTTIQGDEKKGLGAIKRDTIAYFDNVTAKVEQMKNGIEQAGTPDVSGGAEVRTRLVNGMTQIVDAMHRVQSDVRGIKTGNAQQFAQKLQGEATRVQSVFSQVGQAFQVLKNPQLDAAGKADPVCKSLNSQASG
jgi:uncharacterized protein YqgV (UPF0045/DUF77 family)